METENNCVLKLHHLVFDEISFKRFGFRNNSSLNFKFKFRFPECKEPDVIVCIGVTGEKKDEFSFTVRASGYFSIEGDITDPDKIIKQNAAAIIFPYIRTEISLLTAQPEVETVLLPPLNIAQLLERASSESNCPE